MEKPKLHIYERERLAALKSYQVLDSLPEQSFDDLTYLASQICQTPVAVVSLIENDRQWFKSKIGLDVSQTSREVSFCGHALHSPNVMEVPDATNDIRFMDNPLVTGAPKIRFYAGAPLRAPNGLPLGTICVIDTKPKKLTEEQINSLERLSHLVMEQLEIRKTNLGLQQMLVSLGGESRAREARLRSLGHFSSGIAHEINNPLAIMLGAVEIAEMKIAQGEKVDKELNQVRRAVDRAAKVIQGLRTFAQDRTLVHTQNVSVDKILQSVRHSLAPKAQELGVEVKWPGSEHAFISGDELQLRTALEHIVRNAIEAAADGREHWVNLETHVEKGHWVLRCQDSGRGVAPVNIDRIFEPFFTTKPTGHNQGLGLPVARGIVMAHGGVLELKEAAPTTFEVMLP